MGITVTQELYSPHSVALTPAGDILVADTSNSRIRRCPAVENADCTTISDGWGLNRPYGVSVAPNSEFVIVVDTFSSRILLCPAAGGGDCTTVAGGQGKGPGARQLHYPVAALYAPDGDMLIADFINNRIQRCPAAGGGDCSTVAGGQGQGSGPQQLYQPYDVLLRFEADDQASIAIERDASEIHYG